MKRATSIASLTLAAAFVAGLTPAGAAPEEEFRSGATSLIPQRAIIAPESPARGHIRPTEPTIGHKINRAAKSETDKPIPSGPLHVVVSIAKQRATLFANGQPVAYSAVSTGTPGHPTPIGVFSVIQKHKDHYSNLYGAQMPYMQRITWSGSALHQGPLPGYPASHGCIRLTAAFAQLLWKVTRIGARVIVTRDEVTPVEIDMANPFALKPKTVEAPALTTLIKTADATGRVPMTSGAASPAPVVAHDTTGALVTQLAGNESSEQSTKSDGQAAASVPAVKHDAAAAADAPAKEVLIVPVASETKTAATSSDSATEQATKTSGDMAADESKTAPAANEATAEPTARTDSEPVAAAADTTADEPAKEAAAESPAAAADGTADAAADQVPTIEPAPVNFDGTTPAEPPAARTMDQRPVETVPLPAPAPLLRAAKKSNEPVSVFISRKEAKLYVRQRMEPLFDAPVTIEQPSQPIGTHVFTAMTTKGDDGEMRWTVISIPSGFKHTADNKKSSKARNEDMARIEQPIDSMPDARSVFGRIVMPPEAVERISALFIPGSSIIVSDNKLSDETGEYTEFIVLTP